MNLVILYGPPAVGKLTIGTELAKLTGYKLFHNHLIGNVARDLFDFRSPGYERLKHELWHTTFRIAAHEGLPGMIFTFMYEGARDGPYLRELFGVFGEASIDVHLARLRCDPAELRRRIGNESRSQYRKLTDVDQYDELAARTDFEAEVPFGPSFAVDTTHIPPTEAARLIQVHYQLPIVEEGQ